MTTKELLAIIWESRPRWYVLATLLLLGFFLQDIIYFFENI